MGLFDACVSYFTFGRGGHNGRQLPLGTLANFKPLGTTLILL
jgi:hypothetical protein